MCLPVFDMFFDYMLKNFPYVNKAGDMVNKVRALCLDGEFNLRKIGSNDIDLLKISQNNLRNDGTKDKDLKLGNFTDSKAFGVKWNAKDDTLGFIIKINDIPATQQSLLAPLSSIYNLLGLRTPFLLEERQIIQALCKRNVKWENLIDDQIAQEWLLWKNNLITLQDKSLWLCML